MALPSLELCTARISTTIRDGKEQSDEDSGVEMVQDPQSSVSSASPIPTIRCRYLLQHRRKTICPKKRSYSQLRRSLCSDSSISDHERPGSRDSGVRLGASPEQCLDLSLKIESPQFPSCDAVISRDSLDASTSSLLDDPSSAALKKLSFDSDSPVVRQRRLEANARERSRVHTIGAAFESLRRSIPAYSNGQKLSKLAILRVASSYILALSSILEDQPEDFEAAVQACSSAIHLDGKVRRR